MDDHTFLYAVAARVSKLEKLIHSKDEIIPDRIRLAAVCEKFGITQTALHGEVRSARVVAARNAVICELHSKFGWKIEKLCHLTSRSKRHILRVITHKLCPDS